MNHFRTMPKPQDSRMPVKKEGTAMHSWFTTVPRPSSAPPEREADQSPRGMETIVISKKQRRLRHSVTSTLGAIRSHTGCLYWMETPRSPVKNPKSQETYRAGRGRSSPNSARRAARRSGVAWVPSMISAASPEIREKAVNARRETMTMVRSMAAIFLAAYFTASPPFGTAGLPAAGNS